MATEHTKTAALLRLMRQTRPRSTARKLNLRRGGGVPDVVWAVDGRTIWIENKFARHGETAAELVDPLQRVTLHALSTQLPSDVWVVVFRPHAGTDLYRPPALDTPVWTDLSSAAVIETLLRRDP